jgi:hypothetical protein
MGQGEQPAAEMTRERRSRSTPSQSFFAQSALFLRQVLRQVFLIFWTKIFA